MNDQYIIFLSALRNGKYSEIDNVLDFEFFKFKFTDKTLKEFRVEIEDVDKYIDKCHKKLTTEYPINKEKIEQIVEEIP